MGRVKRRSNAKIVTNNRSKETHSKEKNEYESSALRHSKRHRVVNTRYGTPPKILKKSVVKKLEVSKMKAVAINNQKQAVRRQGMEKVKTADQKATITVVRHSQRTRVANRRYNSPFDEASRDSENSVIRASSTSAVVKTESWEPNLIQENAGEWQHCDDAHSITDQSVEIVRYSKRERKPNKRYVFDASDLESKTLRTAAGRITKEDKHKGTSSENKTPERLPKVQGKSAETRTQMKSVSKKEAETCTQVKSLENKQTFANAEDALRHSTRRRVPNKRLEYFESQPQTTSVMDARKVNKMKKNGVANSRLENSGDIRTTDDSLQNHSDSSQKLYNFKPVRDRPLCVDKASTPSSSKDYVSKQEIDEILEEVAGVFRSITWRKDLPHLEKRLSECMTSLHKFNCRLRNANRELKNGLDNISTNATPIRCAQLMRQVEELREQKVFADIRNEAQAKEIKELQERVRYLNSMNGVVQNQSVQGFFASSVSQGPEYAVANGVAESADTAPNGNADLLLHDDDSVEWGGDAWMLRC